MRALRIGLLGDFLPGLRHFLQEFAVLLALSLASQAAAFLRKPQELRCLFHVRKNRAVAATVPKRITGYADGTFSSRPPESGGPRKVGVPTLAWRAWPRLRFSRAISSLAVGFESKSRKFIARYRGEGNSFSALLRVAA